MKVFTFTQLCYTNIIFYFSNIHTSKAFIRRRNETDDRIPQWVWKLQTARQTRGFDGTRISLLYRRLGGPQGRSKGPKTPAWILSGGDDKWNLGEPGGIIWINRKLSKIYDSLYFNIDINFYLELNTLYS